MIKAIITDFDGTLVDTFEANFKAYRAALRVVAKVSLEKDTYKKYYGLKYDELFTHLGIDEIYWEDIRKEKSLQYIKYLSDTKLNDNLFNFLKYCRHLGIKLVIASTASKDNLYAVIGYHNIGFYFDYFFTGEDVSKGKPDPEVYNIALEKLGISADEALVFEDSNVGFDAATAAGLKYIQIK